MSDAVSRRATTFAFHLPQFHPTQLNDRAWGSGFTEWNNVASASALYPGHRQPVVPGALGYYDGRSELLLLSQMRLAEAAGIEGFIFWTYWFGRMRTLYSAWDRLSEMTDLPQRFAVGWANQSWTGIWHGSPDRVIAKQDHLSPHDIDEFFAAFEPILHRPEYIRIGERPLLYIYDLSYPRLGAFIERWRERCVMSGLPPAYVVGEYRNRTLPSTPPDGLDAVAVVRLSPKSGQVRLSRRLSARGVLPLLIRPEEAIEEMLPQEIRSTPHLYPCIVPRWDNTPRSGRHGRVYIGDTRAAFEQQTRRALQLLEQRAPDRRLLFVKSWNEWAEGNYLEPDRDGCEHLRTLRDSLLPLDTRPFPPDGWNEYTEPIGHVGGGGQ